MAGTPWTLLFVRELFHHDLRATMMFRIRPNTVGLRVGRADDVPGLHTWRPNEVPGLHLWQPNDVPGFRLGADGSVPSPLRESTPVNCTSEGGELNCTSPKGTPFFPSVPAPAGFPQRIAPDVAHHHGYDVQSPPGADAVKLMQGVIDRPTPGPSYLNRPATTHGTPNEATPEPFYSLYLGGTRFPAGAPLNPVASYLRHNLRGNPVVVNVTEPGHALFPGYVMHYIVESPEGPRIQTEGEGLSRWQAPEAPDWLRRMLSDDTWRPYQQGVLDRSK
jgi:hypothetical protein